MLYWFLILHISLAGKPLDGLPKLCTTCARSLTFMRWADSQKTSRLTSEFSLKTDVFWSGILTGLCQYILHLFGRVSCIVLLVIINLYKTQTPG